MFSSPQKGFIQHHFSKKKSGAGFTLIELLVVIGILAVLATTTVLILNPAEFLAKSRDSVRVSDLTILNRALRLAELDGASSTALASRVYISLPDIATPADNCYTVANPYGGAAYSLPPLPSTMRYWCVSSTNLRSPLGGGWIPVNFTSIPQGSPLAKLPIDPVNSHINGTYYTYTMGGSWKLTALMEANKHDQSINDGGIFPGVYEIGTNLALTSPGRDQGLVGYWPMDEATGTTIYDASGKGNDGVLTNGATITTSNGGKFKEAVSVGGTSYVSNNTVNSYVFTTNSSNSFNVNVGEQKTIAGWFKGVSVLGKDSNVVWKDGNCIGWSVALTPTGQLRAVLHTGDNGCVGTVYSYTITSALSYGDSSWHHFAWVFNRQSLYMELLVDGASVGTASPDNSYSGAGGTTRFGSNWNNTAPFSGLIDDVRIYNRALSASEIQAIYNATK